MNAKEMMNTGPVVMITTVNEDGDPNAMTAAWVTFASFNPRLITVAIGKNRYTFKNIEENGEFVLNIPGKDLLDQCFEVGRVSYSDNPDKLEEAGVELIESEETEVPRVKGSLAWFECRAKDKFEAGDHYLILGEILNKEKTRDGFPLYHAGGNEFLYKGKIIKP